MFKRIAILFLFLSFIVIASAQKEPVQYFFTERDGRPLDGNYVAYAALLYADSTIEIRIYMIPGMEFNPPMSKLSYFGKYSRKNDTATIKYWSSYSEKRGGTLWRLNKPVINKQTPVSSIKLYPDLWFIVKDEKFSMPGLMIPDLPVSSAITINAVEAVFQGWGNLFKENKWPPGS